MFCITFCTILVSSLPVRSYYTLTQSTSTRTNCLLSAYSVYSKVPSVSGGCNLHTEPEEMAKSRDPLNTDTDTRLQIRIHVILHHNDCCHSGTIILKLLPNSNSEPCIHFSNHTYQNSALQELST